MAKYSFDVQESIPFGIFEKVKNYHRRIKIGISPLPVAMWQTRGCSVFP